MQDRFGLERAAGMRADGVEPADMAVPGPGEERRGDQTAAGGPGAAAPGVGGAAAARLAVQGRDTDQPQEDGADLS